DKIGIGFQGDPAAALLEVLDPAQNPSFRDHSLEINVDLSHVLFIATGNQLGTIHPALLDRMEIISLAGYTEEEKLHIARRYLIPRQLDENGLAPEMVTINDAAIRRMIAQYTREAGVRNLERQIGAVARKVAARVAGAVPVPVAAGGDNGGPAIVEAANLPEYLGPPKIHNEVSFRVSRPGVATGVAWTGEITLSGLVLPVGGIREKALAARRHGIKTFVLPARNEPDLAELAPDVKEAMRFVPVETLEQVLAAALPRN